MTQEGNGKYHPNFKPSIESFSGSEGSFTLNKKRSQKNSLLAGANQIKVTKKQPTTFRNFREGDILSVSIKLILPENKQRKT